MTAGPAPAPRAAAPPRRRLGVTLKEVAALASVHPGTASRALYPGTSHLVRPATAHRVRQAAQALGYLPNAHAASLRTGRTRIAGILIADLSDPLQAALARGAEARLAAAGYLPVIRSTTGHSGTALAVASQMRAHQADGLILAAGAQPAMLADAPWACLSGLPAVCAGHIPAGWGLPAVAPDYALGTRMVMEHLATAGHRVIGCVTGPGAPVSREALAAAAAAAGLTAPPSLARSGKAASVVEGRRCAQSILGTSPACTALVATSDMLAAGCCRAVAEARLSCPQDISVTGFGDVPLAGSVAPPLTTVRLPQDRTGAAAAQLLLSLLEAPGSAPPALLLAPKLITRLSTGQPRSERR